MSFIGKIAEKLRYLDEHSNAQELGSLDAKLIQAATDAPNETVALRKIILDAWEAGKAIDLAGAIYGPGHKRGVYFNEPSPYYRFLAGLVRTQNIRRVCEIGTHFGGSARAMLAGIANHGERRIVTVDVSDMQSGISSLAGITKFTGDANSEIIVKKVLTSLDGGPIDLLFVDADHRFMPTLINIAVYMFLLRPTLVVIDDIELNASMRSLWSAIRKAYGANAVNCVDIVPEIRSLDCGFGIVFAFSNHSKG